MLVAFFFVDLFGFSTDRIILAVKKDRFNFSFSVSVDIWWPWAAQVCLSGSDCWWWMCSFSLGIQPFSQDFIITYKQEKAPSLLEPMRIYTHSSMVLSPRAIRTYVHRVWSWVHVHGDIYRTEMRAEERVSESMWVSGSSLFHSLTIHHFLTQENTFLLPFSFCST